MSQRTLAADAAQEAFKDGLKQVFDVLTTNLSLNDPDAAENAKKGIATCQQAFDVFNGLIQNLPN